jgi:hypothetical protein
MVIIVFLAIIYYNIMHSQNVFYEKLISRYGIKVAFLFPLICLLPFITGS